MTPAPLFADAATESVDRAFARDAVDALSLAYERYGSLVFSMSRRCLGDTLAEEVTQDVFVQAWRSRTRFDPERGSLAGWLTGITRNKIIDAARRRKRDAEPVAEEVDTPLDAPAVDAMLDRMLMADALNRLAPRQKTLIELAFYEQLSHTEIAARQDLPLGTVKSEIRRGLAVMRHHLERGHE